MSETPILDRIEELFRRSREWAKEHPAAAGLGIVLVAGGLLIVYSKVAWRK